MSKFLFNIFFATTIIQLSSAVLTHNEATQRLAYAGISVFGFCSHKGSPLCTSLEGIREETINGLINFRRISRCPMVVTGGTETGYSKLGPYTHENGYRANIRQNSCVDNFILTYLTCYRIGSSAVIICEDASGNKYGFFENHWDIAFYP